MDATNRPSVPSRFKVGFEIETFHVCCTCACAHVYLSEGGGREGEKGREERRENGRF